MKVARPCDQERRDKEGPVCSTQHQTEPVASFVPQKPFHHKAHSLILLLLLFPHTHTPNSFPTSKRTRLTSDLHYSRSMSFKIKHQVFSFLLQLFTFNFFLFSPQSHTSTTSKGWRSALHDNTWTHRWEGGKNRTGPKEDRGQTSAVKTICRFFFM